MSSYQRVIETGCVPVGRGVAVTVAGVELALFRQGDQVVVTEGLCPHRRGPMAEGWVEEGCVACPMHGWRFDLATGRCFDRPDRPLRVFPSRIQEGWVEAVFS